jgi:signal transduction histidine kinase/ligand-binding sensor domain-containing protein
MVQGRFEKVSLGIPRSRIPAILEDADQSLWITAFGHGVFRLRNGRVSSFSVKDGLPDDRVRSLCRDHTGKIWTAGWKGISYWNGTAFVSERAVNAVVSYASSCTEDRHGNFWIASSSGLLRLRDGKVSRIDRSSGLSDDVVWDVFEDRQGNLWVGTAAGLDRFSDSEVRTFTTREGLFQNPGPIIADSLGGMWTASSTHVARIAGNRITVWPIPMPAGSIPLSMLLEPDSGFSIGFSGGLKHWSRERVDIGLALAGLEVRSMLKTRNGDIWIGTLNRGLLRWRRPQGAGAPIETVIANQSIYTLAEDHAGVIWAGSADGGGLFRVGDGNVQHFGKSEGLRSPNVYTIFVDREESVWIGSTGGLSWFEQGRIQTVNSQQGLPSDQVFAILDDAYEHLWFTGYGGIASIEKKSLTQWAAGQRRRLTPTVHRTTNGFQSRFLVFPSAARSTDGHLWFSIGNAIAEITPAPATLRSLDFPVLIEDATIDGVVHSERDRIRIPPGARTIQLRYTALMLSRAETVRFRYRLDGMDKEWVDADDRRVAIYNNLKPGAYTFRVAASAGEEQWQQSSALVLEQLPFFYQTKWFMLLASATALSLAFFAYRLRLQQAVDRIQAGFQERMEERTRIAQELHDTVLQAISGSTMLVENAAEKIPDTLPVVKGALLRAVDRLDVALEESRAALRGLRASASPENNLARQLSAVARDLTGTDIAFDLVITGEAREIRPVIHHEVFRIASEAITNALKHSDATSVHVDLGYLDELRLSVLDNGKGIPEGILQRGKEGHFGLEGMRERADHIGATVEVYSSARVGTEVRIIVPGDIAFESGAITSSLVAKVLSRIRSLHHRTPA